MHKAGSVGRQVRSVLLLPSSPVIPLSKMVSTVAEDTNASATQSEPRGPLKVKRLTPNAYLPSRGSKFAAGYDLYSAYDCVVPSRGKSLVSFLHAYNLLVLSLTIFFTNRSRRILPFRFLMACTPGWLPGLGWL